MYSLVKMYKIAISQIIQGRHSYYNQCCTINTQTTQCLSKSFIFVLSAPKMKG